MDDSKENQLPKRAAKGFAWSFAGRLTCEVLQFATGIVLARLLAPEAFGLFGMVAAITGAAMVFRNFGIGIALVQHSEVDHELFSSAFWFNVFCGLSVSLALFCLAPTIARFYAEPSVLPLCRLAALSFAAGALGTCFQAMLSRQLNYRVLGTVEVLGRTFYAAVTIPLALHGYGAFTLVWGAIAENTLVLCLTAYLARQPLLFRFSWTRLKPLVHFGGWVIAAQFSKHLQENMTYLLVGRFAGKAPLGLFKKAAATSTMPVRHLVWSVGDVLLPSMSRMSQSPTGIQDLQIRTLRLVALLTFPACVGLAMVADPFIIGVYGANWRETVFFLQMFCVLTVLFCILHQLQCALIAIGRANRLAKALAAGAVAQWTGVALGYKLYGLHGLMAGLLMARIAEFLWILWLCRQEVHTTLTEFTKATFPPALLSAGMGVSVWLVRHGYLHRLPALLDLALASLIGVVVYSLLVFAVRPPAIRDMVIFGRNRIAGYGWAQWRLVTRSLDYLSATKSSPADRNTNA